MTVNSMIPLSGQLPPMVNPLQAMGQVASIRDLQAQAQLRQQQAEQQQIMNAQSLQDQSALSKVWSDPQGNLDPVLRMPTPEALQKAGMSPNTLMAYTQKYTGLQTKYDQDQLLKSKGQIEKHMATQQLVQDELRDPATAVYTSAIESGNSKEVASRKAQEVYSQGLEKLKKGGLIPKEEIDRYPTSYDFGRVTQGSKQYEEWKKGVLANKRESTQEAREAETERHNQASEERLEKVAERAGNNQAALTNNSEAIDYAATQLRLNGAMPAGFARSPAAVGAVYARAAAQAKAEGQDAQASVLNAKSVKADSASLNALTKQADAINAFESTAIKNLDMLVAQSAKVDRSSWPLLNKALISGKLETGDPEAAKFFAILRPTVDEYAKILSGATGAAGASDASRREAFEIISPYLSNEQIKELKPFLKQELKNRTDSLEEQRDIIKSRMSGGSKPDLSKMTPEQQKKILPEIKKDAAGLMSLPGAPGSKKLESQDVQAINWAKANPTDPRAKAILASHGI